MPQNLLEPTWMELDSDDHFDCPERGRRTEHEVQGATRRFEDFIDTYAPDVGTGPRLPAELLVSRCEPGGEAYFLQLSTRRVHTFPNACFPAAWNGASR
jgi:hypothetical protein